MVLQVVLVQQVVQDPQGPLVQQGQQDPQGQQDHLVLLVKTEVLLCIHKEHYLKYGRYLII